MFNDGDECGSQHGKCLTCVVDCGAKIVRLLNLVSALLSGSATSLVVVLLP